MFAKAELLMPKTAAGAAGVAGAVGVGSAVGEFSLDLLASAESTVLAVLAVSVEFSVPAGAALPVVVWDLCTGDVGLAAAQLTIKTKRDKENILRARDCGFIVSSIRRYRLFKRLT